MKAWTPAQRLRPLSARPRIDYAGGKYVVRQSGIRLDPTVTDSERWLDARFWPVVEGVCTWVVLPAFLWWAIIEGSKIVYSFAFNHPFGL